MNHRDIVPGIEPLLMSFEYILAGIILAALAFLFIRNIQVACLLSFLLQLGNFYLGPVQDYLIKIAGSGFYSKISILVLVYLLFVMVVLLSIRKKRPGKPRYVLFLNTLFVFLIAFEIIQPLFKKQGQELLATKSASEAPLTPGVIADSTKPDVFLVVLDEYAGRKTLVKGVGEDNSGFINFLQSRGFFVAGESRANYNSTLYSIASILNLNYLDVKVSGTEKRSDVSIAYRNISDNFLSQYLPAKGYTFINNSWFSMRNVTQLDNPSYGPEGRAFISAQTVLNRFKRNGLLGVARQLGWKGMERNILQVSKVYNEEVLKNLEAEAIAKTSKPRFVYSHFSMPHYPYYFDRNGYEYSLDSLAKITVLSNRHYVEYLLYCNNMIKRVVEKLQASATRPYMIYIVSDHGNRKMQGVDWDTRAYSSLFAYYDSRSSRPVYPDDISNVNMFRYWLEFEFGEKMKPLPDTTYNVVFTSD